MAFRNILHLSNKANGISFLCKLTTSRLTGSSGLDQGTRYSSLTFAKSPFLTKDNIAISSRHVSLYVDTNTEEKANHTAIYVLERRLLELERRVLELEKQLEIKSEKEEQMEQLKRIEKQTKKLKNRGIRFQGGLSLNDIKVELNNCTSLTFAVKILHKNAPDWSMQIKEENEESMNRIWERLHELAEERTSTDFKTYVLICQRGNPHAPFHYHKLYYMLQDFVLRYSSCLSFGNIKSVVRFLYHICHVFNQDFKSLVNKKFEESVDNINIQDLIDDLYCLSLLNIYPEKHICRLFSLENHPTIAKILVHGTEQAYKFNVLNRSIILDCPHLQIPWIGTDSVINTERSQRNLEKTLDDVLGQGFYKLRQILPYNIHIDVEAFINKDGEVLPYEVGKKLEDQSVQRLAIILLDQVTVWFQRDINRSGTINTKIRHLEMMGCRVVTVPKKEWFALISHEDRIKYLHGKIFSK